MWLGKKVCRASGIAGVQGQWRYNTATAILWYVFLRKRSMNYQNRKFAVGDQVRCPYMNGVSTMTVVGFHNTESKKVFYYKCALKEPWNGQAELILSESNLRLEKQRFKD